jgi:hypothetical protein
MSTGDLLAFAEQIYLKYPCLSHELRERRMWCAASGGPPGMYDLSKRLHCDVRRHHEPPTRSIRLFRTSIAGVLYTKAVVTGVFSRSAIGEPCADEHTGILLLDHPTLLLSPFLLYHMYKETSVYLRRGLAKIPRTKQCIHDRSSAKC